MVARLKTNLHIRAKTREMRSWRRAAKREGTTLSEWIRTGLNLLVSVDLGLADPAVRPPTVPER